MMMLDCQDVNAQPVDSCLVQDSYDGDTTENGIVVHKDM